MTRRRHGKPVDVPPNGSAAPLTISAICHTDAVVDALSARHFVVAAGPRKAGVPDGADPAVRLLQSLILDVDQGVSAASAPAASAPSAKRSPAPSAPRPRSSY